MLLDGDLTVDASSEGPRMKAALSYEGSQAAANPSGEGGRWQLLPGEQACAALVSELLQPLK